MRFNWEKKDNIIRLEWEQSVVIWHKVKLDKNIKK